jgi:hypothetical protein
MTSKRYALCLLLLVLATACASTPQATWRRIAELEEVYVVTCAADSSLSWMVRSRQEQQALFTPEFHRECPSGTLMQQIWPCCDQPGHQVVRSRAQVEQILADMAARPYVSLSEGTRRAYLAHIDRLVPDFSKEALVLFVVPYGPTGSARASLDATQRERVLDVAIRVKVPPPPLTPNTATFYFAVAVDRAKIEEIELVTELPAVPDLDIVPGSPTVQRIILPR